MEFTSYVLLWIVIGTAIGVLANLVVRAPSRKLWVDIVIGIFGALTSGLVYYIHDSGPTVENFVTWSIVATFAGAALLLFLLRLYNFRQDF